MRVRRVVVLAIAGLGLSVLLLDWTLGTLDVLTISRQVDARRLRASMQAVDGTASLVHEPALALRFTHGRARFVTGPLGERVGETPGARSGSTLLVVGDGAALGAWTDDELTFARGLERERAPDGRAVRVVNGSTLFLDVADPIALEQHWLPNVRPDVVLLCGPAVDRAQLGVLRGIGAGAGQDPSFLGRVLPSIWEVDRALGGERPRDAESEPQPITAEAALARMLAAVEVVRRTGAKPIVVDLGGLAGLTASCAAASVPSVDASFSDTDRLSRVFVEPTFGWPNAFGHERIRAKLVPGLVALGVLAASGSGN